MQGGLPQCGVDMIAINQGKNWINRCLAFFGEIYDKPLKLTHNLKVIGSNPIPATTFTELKNKSDPSPLSALARIACCTPAFGA